MSWRWENFIILPTFIIVHPSSTKARKCSWAKKSSSYPRCRAKIWWIHFYESEEIKRNSWVDLQSLFTSWRSSVQKIINYLCKTTSWIWTTSMGTTFEKIYNYSGKCAAPSNKIGGWFSSHELLRKTKKTESTLFGLQESSRRCDGEISNISTPTAIIRYLKISDFEAVLVENTTTNWYGKHPKMVWEDSRQIFSTSKRSKPGMSSQKKSYMPGLSTHLKTNWM